MPWAAGNGDWGNYYLTGNVTASGSSSMNADVALRASNVDFNVASGGTLDVGGTVHNGYAFSGSLTGGSTDPWWTAAAVHRQQERVPEPPW